jgi:hypothetical protein
MRGANLAPWTGVDAKYRFACRSGVMSYGSALEVMARWESKLMLELWIWFVNYLKSLSELNSYHNSRYLATKRMISTSPHLFTASKLLNCKTTVTPLKSNPKINQTRSNYYRLPFFFFPPAADPSTAINFACLGFSFK